MFRELEIPDHKEVYVDELIERGEWITCVIHTNGPWPVKRQKIEYRGETIWVVPIMKEHAPMLAMKLKPGQNRKDMAMFLMRFLSVLSWVEERGYRTEGVGGGSMPFPTGRSKDGGNMICESFDWDYVPEPNTKEEKLALALMREGRSLNHPGYAFLAFYRVLEAIFPNSAKRRSWIANNVELIDDHRGKEALKKLKATGVPDIGRHLYESGRCAMAHAASTPVIDPDDPSDLQRLWQELPIMEGLAVRAIDTQLGIRTGMSLYREHLYELEGFKKIFGPDLVDKFQRGEQVPLGTPLELPRLSVRIKGKEVYAPLEDMTVVDVGQSQSFVHILLESKNGLVRFYFALDFENERVKFEVFSDVGVLDDQSVLAAETDLTIARFTDDYFGNGRLNIFSAETGELLSRKDAYLPVNMYFDGNKAERARLLREALIQRRKDRDKAYGDEIKRLSTPYTSTVCVTFGTIGICEG